MYKIYISFLILINLVLVSCNRTGVPMLSTGVSGTEGLPAEQLSFAKFKDIPIPDGSVMDMNNTVIFGSDDEWFGRLSLIPNLSHAETFDFFRYETASSLFKNFIFFVKFVSVVFHPVNKSVLTPLLFICSNIQKSLCNFPD